MLAPREREGTDWGCGPLTQTKMAIISIFCHWTKSKLRSRKKRKIQNGENDVDNKDDTSHLNPAHKITFRFLRHFNFFSKCIMNKKRLIFLPPIGTDRLPYKMLWRCRLVLTASFGVSSVLSMRRNRPTSSAVNHDVGACLQHEISNWNLQLQLWWDWFQICDSSDFCWKHVPESKTVSLHQRHFYTNTQTLQRQVENVENGASGQM